MLKNKNKSFRIQGKKTTNWRKWKFQTNQGENVLLYLLSKDFFSLDKFYSILSKEIKIKKFFRYSEEILNLIIGTYLLQNVKILSVDAIYYEYILGYKTTFRCDMVFIFHNILYIIENKF